MTIADQITVIIPAFNEEARIGDVVRRARTFAAEILVIDDGSTDHTATIAEEAGARVIKNNSNLGYLESLQRGFTEATGSVVVTVDGDGELPPESIPALIQPILDDRADMVQGARHRPVRPSEHVLNAIARLSSPVGDSGTGLRAIRTDLATKAELDGVCLCGILTLEIIRHGGRVVDVPVELTQVDKPRRVAWFHWKQAWLIVRWLIKNRRGRHPDRN